MTSQSEDEGDVVHPMVSNLLGQKFVPRAAGEEFKYDREEMMRLRKVPLSVHRPAGLSKDFDGDDGKFSPFKWLEHRWEIEGIKNRAPSKKLQVRADALRAEADENTGLSPQRRGFSGGCRAPPSEDRKDREASSSGMKDDGWSTVDTRADRDPRERLNSSQGTKWRSGGSTGSDKYSGKSNDFKLPFQKGGSVNDKDKNGRAANSWKTVEGKEKQGGSFSSNGKFIPARNYRGEERSERLPEWADGPTTMDDMIELKGFEEPTKKRKGKAKEEKKTEKPDKNAKEKKDNDVGGQRSSGDNAGMGSSAGHMPTSLPSSDAELAAILGLLDMPTDMATSFDKVSEDKPPQSAPSGSRLSRFFNKSSEPTTGDSTSVDARRSPWSSSSGAPMLPPGLHPQSHDAQPNPPSSSMLAKIFANTPSSGAQTPSSNAMSHQPSQQPGGFPPGPGGLGRGMPMRLEDLERGMNGRPEARNTVENTVKGNILQDPNQHAQLMNKLSSMAKQQVQEDVAPAARSNSGSPPQHPPPGGHPPFPGFMPGMPPFPPGTLPPALAHPMLQAQLHQAFNNQMQHALAAAVANGGGTMPHPQIVERIRANVMSSLVAQQQHAVVMALQAQHAKQQQQQGGVGNGGGRPQTTQMIPASVQRQMNKSTTSGSDERRGPPPTDKDREHEDGSDGRSQSNETMKKLHMQHQYNSLMGAMQAGLPLASSWRGSNHGSQQQPGPGGAQPTPQQMQVLMAAAAQNAQLQQQMRNMGMMNNSKQTPAQTQAAVMKLMQMQAAQQQQMQQQQQQQAAASGDRSSSHGMPSGYPPQHGSHHGHHGNHHHQQQQQQSNGHPAPLQSELSQVGPIQTPLEKLLAAAGVQAAHFTGSGESQARRTSNSANMQSKPGLGLSNAPATRPMSLEELERHLTEKSK